MATLLHLIRLKVRARMRIRRRWSDLQLTALWCLHTTRSPAVVPRLLHLKYHRTWTSPSRNWRSGRCLACMTQRGTRTAGTNKRSAASAAEPVERYQMKHILHFRMTEDQGVSLRPIMRGNLMMKNHTTILSPHTYQSAAQG